LLLLGLVAPAGAAIRAGDTFPALEPAHFEGQLPETTGRVVLVDFWASWCAPCKVSFPHYARLHADYASRGLVIVAVSVDEDAAAYAAFVRKLNPPFAVARDRDHALVRQVDVPAMPTCYLIARDGRVRSVHQGFHGEPTDRALRQEIEKLLADSPASP
jgi:thiol-disulfide isomerase/thioredoxin